ncbi:MAG: hypothetical protein ACXVCX_01545 [Ktedonobacterales bacterium]
MLFVTTDVIPQSYEPLGVFTTFVARVDNLIKGHSAMNGVIRHANKQLGEQASKLGGNGVIGICYTFAATVSTLASGTAIRIRR